MDATVSIALEEICSRGGSGITLSGLWSALETSLAGDNLDLSPGLKQALRTSILAVPALCFEPRAAVSSDAAVAEELGTTIVTDERLRNSFLGLFKPHSLNSSVPSQQRRALERLAVARVLKVKIALPIWMWIKIATNVDFVAWMGLCFVVMGVQLHTTLDVLV